MTNTTPPPPPYIETAPPPTPPPFQESDTIPLSEQYQRASKLHQQHKREFRALRAHYDDLHTLYIWIVGLYTHLREQHLHLKALQVGHQELVSYLHEQYPRVLELSGRVVEMYWEHMEKHAQMDVQYMRKMEIQEQIGTSGGEQSDEGRSDVESDGSG